MNPTWIRIRLALLLLALFLLGALVGHLVTRRLPAKPAKEAKAATSPTAVTPPQAEPEDDGLTKKQAARATRQVMVEYQAALSLTPEQMETLKPHFKKTGIEMSYLPRGSQERLQKLEAFHQQLHAVLTPEQQKLSDAILERARLRYQSQSEPATP